MTKGELALRLLAAQDERDELSDIVAEVVANLGAPIRNGWDDEYTARLHAPLVKRAKAALAPTEGIERADQ